MLDEVTVAVYRALKRGRDGRNSLTSDRGNSLWCTDHGEKRSSRAAGIRGSLKKRETWLSERTILSKRKICHQFV